MIKVFLMTWSLCTFDGPMCLNGIQPFDTYKQCVDAQKAQNQDHHFSGCAVMSTGADDELRQFTTAPTLDDWRIEE